MIHKPGISFGFLTSKSTGSTIRTLMPDRLPTRVNPFQLAAKGVSLSGVLPLATMARLRSCAGGGADAKVVLEFRTDESGRPRLSGSVRAVVAQTCQRCLAPVRAEIDGRFDLMVVRSDEEAKQLRGDAEPLLAADETVTISELTEDELLLALPVLPAHDEIADCDPEMVDRIRHESDEHGGRGSPFAVLKSWHEK
ncbi:MAG: YceD family protein [Gammaproteobacteria bacterium]